MKQLTSTLFNRVNLIYGSMFSYTWNQEHKEAQFLLTQNKINRIHQTQKQFSLFEDNLTHQLNNLQTLRRHSQIRSTQMQIE